MMELFIAPRAGLWCRSLRGWDAFVAALAAGSEPASRIAEPYPELLPPREGRRAPLYVRLAIDVGVQSCCENDVPLDEVMTVFASSLGDIQVTDYMCRELARPDPLLSPTRFHNSVHNVASGYWSIGASNRSPSTAIAAQEFTFPAALLEAAVMVACDGGTVLLVAHDVPAPEPLDDVCSARQPFALGMLVAARKVAAGWRPLSLCHRAASASWPAARSPWLRQLAADNDSARASALVEALADAAPFTLALPVGADASLEIAVGAS